MNVLVCTAPPALPHALAILHPPRTNVLSEKQKQNKVVKRGKKRTDVIYDGVELGLVSCGEEDVEPGFSKLDRKLASDAVRCARDD